MRGRTVRSFKTNCKPMRAEFRDSGRVTGHLRPALHCSGAIAS